MNLRCGCMGVLCLCMLAGSCDRSEPPSPAGGPAGFPKSAPFAVDGTPESLRRVATAAGVPAMHGAVLESVGNQDFKQAWEQLTPGLQKVWDEQSFAADVKKVRDAVGADWKPELTGYMVGQNPMTPSASTAYKLTAEWQSSYDMEIRSIDLGDGHRIFYWMMSLPSAADEKTLAAAKETASAFFEDIRKNDFAAARARMLPEAASQVSGELLDSIRSGFFLGGFGKVVYDSQVRQELVNGQWLLSLVARPLGREVSTVEVLVDMSPPGPRIASFNTRIKISD